jgi:hypothetical protein
MFAGSSSQCSWSTSSTSCLVTMLLARGWGKTDGFWVNRKKYGKVFLFLSKLQLTTAGNQNTRTPRAKGNLVCTCGLYKRAHETEIKGNVTTQTRLVKRNQAEIILLSKQVTCLSRMTWSAAWNCEAWDSQATDLRGYKSLHTISQELIAKPQRVLRRMCSVSHGSSPGGVSV